MNFKKINQKFVFLQSIFRHDVFISYRRSEGATYAAWLYQRLSEADLLCFLDDHEAIAGTPLTPTIKRALRRARILVVIMTECVHESEWVRREVDLFAKTERPIVPIRFDGAMNKESAIETPLKVIFERDVRWVNEVPGFTGADAPSDTTIADIRALFHFRRSKLLLRLTTVSIMLLLAGIALWAVTERSRAIKNQKIAVSQELALRSEFRLPADPHESLRFAVRALDSYQTSQAELALRRAFRDDHLRAIIGGNTDPVRKAVFSEDGTKLATLHYPWRAEIRPTANLASVTHIDDISTPDSTLNGFAFALHDTVLLTWTNNGRVKVSDAVSGRTLGAFGGSQAFMPDVYLASDQATIAISNLNSGGLSTLDIWDIVSKKIRRTVNVAPGEITAVAFTPDSRQVVVATLNRKAKVSTGDKDARAMLQLIDVDSGNSVSKWSAGQERIASLQISKSGQYIVSAIGDVPPPAPPFISSLSIRGHHNDAMKIWRREVDAYHQVFSALSYQNPRVFMTPDERLIIFADENTAQAISIQPLSLYKTLSGHQDYITSITSVSANNVAATSSSDGTARLWSLDSGQVLCQFRGHVGALNSIAVSAGQHLAVTVGRDGSARVWDTRCSASSGTILMPQIPFRIESIDTPQLALATGWVAQISGSRDIQWLSYETTEQGLIKDQLDANLRGIVAMADSARRLLVISSLGQTGLVDLEKGSIVPIGREHPDFMFAALSENAAHLVLADTRGVAEVFDTNASKLPLIQIQRDASLVRSDGFKSLPAAFRPRPEGSIFVAAAFDRSGIRLALSSIADVELWSLVDRKLIARLSAHSEPIQNMIFSPDSQRILTLAYGRVRGSYEAPIIWSTLDGQLIRRLEGSQGNIVSAAFTPDGHQLLTVTSEGHLILWNSDDGSLSAEGKLAIDAPLVRTIAFPDSGEFAAVGCDDGRLFVVAVDTLATLFETTLATRGVRNLRFAPHSHVLAALLDDGSVVKYKCSLCSTLTELMTEVVNHLAIYQSEPPFKK
jgi:WD40 repeat protein